MSSPTHVDQNNTQERLHQLMVDAQTHAKRGEWKKAIESYGKVLSVDKSNSQAIVERGKCFLANGNYVRAINDADTLLSVDEESAQGLLLKAEALFSLGHFEYALVFFHRGNKVRPTEDFRMGIQKTKAAIESSFGSVLHAEAEATNLAATRADSRRPHGPLARQSIVAAYDNANTGIQTKEPGETQTTSRFRKVAVIKQRQAPPVSLGDDMRTKEAQLLGDLNADYVFLEELRANPVVDQRGRDILEMPVSNALGYLNQRTQFWRQRKPFTVKTHSSRPHRPRTSSAPRPPTSKVDRTSFSAVPSDPNHRPAAATSHSYHPDHRESFKKGRGSSASTRVASGRSSGVGRRRHAPLHTRPRTAHSRTSAAHGRGARPSTGDPRARSARQPTYTHESVFDKDDDDDLARELNMDNLQDSQQSRSKSTVDTFRTFNQHASAPEPDMESADTIGAFERDENLQSRQVISAAKGRSILTQHSSLIGSPKRELRGGAEDEAQPDTPQPTQLRETSAVSLGSAQSIATTALSYDIDSDKDLQYGIRTLRRLDELLAEGEVEEMHKRCSLALKRWKHKVGAAKQPDILAMLHHRAGLLKLRLGRNLQAMVDFARELEISIEFNVPMGERCALEMLAEGHMAKQETKQALAKWHRALLLYPIQQTWKQAYAHGCLSRLFASMGNASMAEEHARRSLEWLNRHEGTGGESKGADHNRESEEQPDDSAVDSLETLLAPAIMDPTSDQIRSLRQEMQSVVGDTNQRSDRTSETPQHAQQSSNSDSHVVVSVTASQRTSQANEHVDRLTHQSETDNGPPEIATGVSDSVPQATTRSAVDRDAATTRALETVAVHSVSSESDDDSEDDVL